MPRLHRLRTACITTALIVVAATKTSAQVTDLVVPRPMLPPGADTNSWEPYYDLGMQLIGKDFARSQQAFAWSAHLDPSRAEPQFALWAAFWNLDMPRFMKWLNDDEDVLRSPDVMRADSIRMRAFRRNPFVHQGLFVQLLDRLPGEWSDTPVTEAWIQYARAELGKATGSFGKLIDRDPKKYGYLRFVRAGAFVNNGMSDSALVDLQKLLADERAADAKTIGSYYQSKELLEYAIALLNGAAGRRDAAMEAAGDALLENAGFTPARDLLGRYSLQARDAESAVLQYDEAVRTDSTDVVMRIGLGEALVEAKRPRDAVEEFKAAIRLEPFYSRGYWGLGVALQAAGDTAGARQAYMDYLARAPRGDDHVDQAQIRLGALKGG